MYEILNKRTLNAKIYDIGMGQRRLEMAAGNIHYRNDEKKFVDINMHPSDRGAFFENTTTPYKIRVSKDKAEIQYHSRKKGIVTMRLVRVGDKTVLNIRPEIRDNCIYYPDVVPGVDVYLVLRPRNVEWFKIIKTPEAPTTLEWEVEAEDADDLVLGKDIKAKDSNRDKAEIIVNRSRENKLGNRVFYSFTETFTGRIFSVVNKKRRERVWTTNPKYPIIIDDVIGEEVSTGADDGVVSFSSYYNSEGAGSSSYLSSTGTSASLNVGLSGSTSEWEVGKREMYTRWQTAGIPAGSTITNVALANKQISSAPGGSGLKLQASFHDVDDAAVAVSAPQFFGLPRTTANEIITLPVLTTGVTTISFAGLTSALQEVIDRTGWASGNALQALFDVTQFATGLPATTIDEAHNLALFENPYSVNWVGAVGGWVLSVTFTPPASGSLPLNNPYRFSPFLIR